MSGGGGNSAKAGGANPGSTSGSIQDQPTAALALQEGTVANTSSFANSGMGIGPGQALAQTGVNYNAATTAFQEALNNSLINQQNTANQIAAKTGGGNNGGTQVAGTGGFTTGLFG